MKLVQVAIAVYSLLIPAVWGVNNASHSQDKVFLYWGQNTLGYLTNFHESEKELWWYCNWDSVDAIILSFVQEFPGSYSSKYNVNIPTLNFPHHKNPHFSANQTSTMKTLESDIDYCQKRNKRILLSFGGQNGDYGFASDNEAASFADTVWQMFGEQDSHNKSKLPRPFGKSVIDGFDFDIENRNTIGYTKFISTLQSYTNKASKKFYYGAAPQCVFPDASMNSLMTESELDFIFVQFYNNECNSNTKKFNWDQWSQFAAKQNTQLFLGLPGSANSSSTGYIDSSTELQNIIAGVKSDTHFGGVMLWEASTAFENKPNGSRKSYPNTIKNILLREVDNSTIDINDASFDKKIDHIALVLAMLITILLVY